MEAHISSTGTVFELAGLGDNFVNPLPERV